MRLPALSLECAELGGRDCLRIRGLAEPVLARLRALDDAQLAELLPFFPDESLAALQAQALPASRAPRGMQCMAGRYQLEAGAVAFVPRFPLLEHTKYTVLLHPALLAPDGAPVALGGPSCDWRAAPTLSAIRATESAVPTAEVVGVYPSCAELPVNQLKLYVHFSSPMSEGHAARCVRLQRADSGGRELEAAFLAMEPELWDPERRRLTLLLDPGRIKRGLVPHATDGYPLELGVPIRAVVDEAFRDHAGHRLVRGFSRTYRVGAQIRRKVRTADWRYEYPAAGSRAALTVHFDRPLDHALLQHSLRVLDRTGRPIAGEVALEEGERSWRFRPAAPWQGEYTLRVAAHLEDLAGNSLARVFDRELARSADAPLPIDHVEHAFSCA